MATNSSTVDAIVEAVRKRRTFTHEIQERGFTLRLPTDHQLQVEYLRAGGTQDPASWLVMTRRLLEAGIQDWRGVTDDDNKAGEDKADVAFHTDLVPLLLDAQPEWSAELSNELTKRIEVKRQETSNGN